MKWLLKIILNHGRFARSAVHIINGLPFNNQFTGGGAAISVGASLIRKCKVVSHGENNRIIIGENCRLQGCTIYFNGSGNMLVIADQCYCKAMTIWFEDNGNTIEIGEHTKFINGAQFTVMERTGVHVGKDCLIASNVDVRTGDSHSIVKKGTKFRMNPSKSVSIGNHVWIGTGVRILKGTSVADNCVVGAGSLLCKNYESLNCVIAGSPAIVVKTDIDWIEERV